MKHLNLTKIAIIFIFGMISVSSVSGDIDMREANVMGVQWQQIDSSNWEFSVTLLHDDNGEDGYADYWVVETLDQTELGKRILTHAHGNTEFTRSGVIRIPPTIFKVIVRGHDQTHNFGGQVAIIDLELQTIELFDQGPDRITFEGNDTSNSISQLNSPEISSSTKSAPLELSNLLFSFIGIGLLWNNKRTNPQP